VKNVLSVSVSVSGLFSFEEIFCLFTQLCSCNGFLHTVGELW
jgi:hypothetical protein